MNRCVSVLLSEHYVMLLTPIVCWQSGLGGVSCNETVA